VTAGTPWYNLKVYFAQPAQPLMPVIVRVIEQPAKEIGVADVLLGAIGITGLFLLGAALLGFLLGGAFILFRRWQAGQDVEGPVDDTFQLTQPPPPRT
jgi:hypothetical protein